MVNNEIRLIIFCAAKDGEALYSQQKSPKYILGCNLKKDRMIYIHFQSKPFNIIVIQVYALTSWSWSSFYEGPTDLVELTPQKDVLFIIGDWNAKVGSQETPGVTGKFGLGVEKEAGQKLIEFCQENTLVIANTLFQQHNYAKSVQIIFQSLGHC